MLGKGAAAQAGPLECRAVCAVSCGVRIFEISADPAMRRRLRTLLLLHRFNNLARQIRIEGWQQKAADLYELERSLWPI
jgi:hygromycin-B 7''-O-kinase